MTSPAIPSSDKALLEAQAQAGPAGVQAYEAAKAELKNQQATTLAEAARAAQARGGPAGAMESELATASQIYDSRQQSMTQAAAGAQAAYDRRNEREGAYSAAVQDARGLIEAQAKAAADPIRLRGEANVNQIRQQGQSAVDQLRAQMDVDTARFNADMRAAEAAARLEDERWRREMEQRERLAAAQRAASARAASGPTTKSLSEGELQSLLRAGGTQYLGQVIQQIDAGTRSDTDLAKALDATLKEQIKAGLDARTVRTRAFDDLFPEPNRLGGPDNESNVGWQRWKDMRRRWGQGDIRPEDFQQAQIETPGGQLAIDQGARIRYEEAVAQIQAERQRADAALASANAAATELGLAPDANPLLLGTLGSANRFAPMLDVFGKQEPDLASFINMARQSGMYLRNPLDVAQALGAAEAPTYQITPGMDPTRAIREAQRFQAQEVPDNLDVASRALQEAMIRSVTPQMMQQYGLDPAELQHALQRTAGMSAYQLAQGDEGSYRSMMEARQADMNAQLGEYTTTWNDQLADAASARQEQLDRDNEASVAASAQAAEKAELLGQQTWADVTGGYSTPRSYGFDSYAQAAAWLQAPIVVPEPSEGDDPETSLNMQRLAGLGSIQEVVNEVLRQMNRYTTQDEQEAVLNSYGIRPTAQGDFARLYRILEPKVFPERSAATFDVGWGSNLG